ncbi:MAG: MBL fold metallo-hydrolase [Chloroflexi bacterium]|jgi:L-ascorbate metabolism protein UlaG (beta-lactamase superfamily)|nr:MBL fold metallo-hydrolase [Chloroflexota bacterium]
MEITWLGHSCFKIKGKSGTIITDPFDSTSGYKLGKLTADIVTLSHNHPGHNYAAGIGGDPKVITGPGEYDIAGIFVYGVRTFHDIEKGKQRGNNTSYLIEIDDVKVCHLGDLGHVPSAAQIDEISDADVLLIPVGGESTLDATTAVEVVNLISPDIVIPMHYQTESSRPELDALDKFLKEIGTKDVTPVPKLSVNKSLLPLEMDVVVMDYQR